MTIKEIRIPDRKGLAPDERADLVRDDEVPLDLPVDNLTSDFLVGDHCLRSTQGFSHEARKLGRILRNRTTRRPTLHLY